MPEPVADESPIDARTGGPDAMIALQVPGYSLWTKTVELPELEDLFDSLGGQRSWMMQSDWLLGDESGRAIFPKGLSPLIEGGS
jgi:hypothetical protein